MIISNDKNNLIEIPKFDNVKIMYRDNVGYDFGGWTEALITDKLYDNYDNFIFVNSSVIGPFLRDRNVKWTDVYLEGLKDNVKLFGSTINCINDPHNKAHVQSYIFSMDKETLIYLMDCKIFDMENSTKTFCDTIEQKEILMSRKIIEKGWNIGSLLSCFNGVDFTFKHKSARDYKNLLFGQILFSNDLMFPEYVNYIWNVYDLVFIKGNRINIHHHN